MRWSHTLPAFPINMRTKFVGCLDCVLEPTLTSELRDGWTLDFRPYKRVVGEWMPLRWVNLSVYKTLSAQDEGERIVVGDSDSIATA